MHKKILTLGIYASILSSCSFFSPEYQKPETETPIAWAQQNKDVDADSSVDLTNVAWWRLFNDSQLNSFITIALRDNNQLQVAIGNIKQAQAEIDKANYSWLPTATVGGGGFVAQTFASDVSGPAKQVLPNNSGTYSGSLVGVVPSYTINLVREIKMGEIARLGAKMQENLKNAARLSVISQVSASYFSLVTAKAQLVEQERKVKQYGDLLYYTQKQYDLGSASKANLTATNQQLETEKGKLANIKNDIVHFKNSLRILMGRNPGEIDSGKTLGELNIEHSVPTNLPSTVLESRPDVAIAEYRLQTANANIGLARSQFFPSIDLTGAFGNATLALAQLATMNAGVWAGQVLAAAPVFNMTILADSDKAKAQFYEGYYEYMNTVHTAFQDVDDDLSEHSSANEELAQEIASLNSANELNNIFNQKYKKGAISKMEYTVSEINITNQQMQVNQSKMKTLLSIVNLYQSFGAGYNVDNYSSAVESNPAWSK